MNIFDIFEYLLGSPKFTINFTGNWLQLIKNPENNKKYPAY